MNQWDRFADDAGRTLTALGWTDSVDVYQPTEGYTAGAGYDVNYPDTPTETIDAALDTPSVSAGEDRGGTTETADRMIYVRADLGIDFRGAGRSGEAKTGLETTTDGTRYIVDTVEPQDDGFLKLACAEVDGFQ